MQRLLKTLCIVTTLLTAAVVPVHAALGLGPSKPQSFADIVEPLLPCAVNIATITEVKPPQGPQGQPFAGPGQPGQRGAMGIEELFRQFMQGMQQGQPRRLAAGGSGFIVAQEGKTVFVVTCNHVIQDVDEIKLTLHDGEEVEAIVVGRDRRTDLALIKFETDKRVTIAKWGNSEKARVGDWVIAIGSPFGLGNTVTTGIVSTASRDVSAPMARSSGADFVSGYIQTDASINMGNSGGAMFNLDGEVIGVNTAIYTPNGGNIGIGFAIPSTLAKQVIEQLKEFGRTRRGWLGVQIQIVSDEIAETLGLDKARGALIGSVSDQGPAKAAGVKTQDVILKFNNVDVKDAHDLPRIVGDTEIGKSVPIVVWRGGKEVTLQVKVGEWEKAEEAGLLYDKPEENPEKKPQQSEQVLGMVTKVLTDSMKERYGMAKDTKGLFVTFVNPSTETFAKYIRPGDVIQQLTAGNMKLSPTKPDELKSFVEKLKAAQRKKVLILLNTKGNLRYVALSLEEDKENEKDTKKK